MRWIENLMPSRRSLCTACALVATLVAGIAIGVALTTPAAEAQPTRTYTGDVGLHFHFVKQSEATAFEGVMQRLDSALDSVNPSQARGWKVFRADTDITGGGNVMYVWVIDPVASGADYTVANILNEAVPDEVQELYESYNGAYTDGPTKQVRLNLDLVRDFGR